MIRGGKDHFVFDCKKIFMEKLRFMFIAGKKSTLHCNEAKRGRGMNKEMEVKTLKVYSISEWVLYTTTLEHSYRPVEDRTRLQRILRASLRIRLSSLILPTSSVFFKSASGCSGILLEMQIFCMTPDVINQIPHFSKIPRSCAYTLKFEKYSSGRGESPVQWKKHYKGVPGDPNLIIPILSVLG